MAGWVNEHIWELNRMQKQPEEVRAEPGAQCSAPYECWYYGYCHPDYQQQEMNLFPT